MNAGRISRRQLAGAIVGGCVAPGLAAAGDDKAKEKEPEVKPAEATANALLEIVKVRHGKLLDDAKLKATRQALRGVVETGGRLAQVKLAAEDEPAFVFGADVP